MPRHRCAGQATTEYVAILLLVAVVFGGVATVAAPGIGQAVVRTLETGVCMVGGDICRDVDARAAGLEPCVTEERSEREASVLDVVIVRYGNGTTWQVEARSDGSALVTRLRDHEGGLSAGVGPSFGIGSRDGSAGAQAGVAASVVLRYESGESWRFGDVEAARAFVERMKGAGRDAPPRPADVRWTARGDAVEAGVGADLAGLVAVGVRLPESRLLGTREEGGRRTHALEVDDAALAAGVRLPGLVAAAGSDRPAAVMELTTEDGRPREIVLRTGSARGDRIEEIEYRIDLRPADARAAADRFVWPRDRSQADIAAFRDYIAQHGSVERRGYSTRSDRGGFGLSGRVGVGLGFEHEEVTTTRRLTDAVAWVRGGPPQHRFDCLGV